jgi:hypothetical protein
LRPPAADFDRYLDRFNARDYDFILCHYAEQFELRFAGYVLRSKQQVRDFYRFFHDYVRESIRVDAFVASDDMIAIEAVVRLEGLRTMPKEAASAAGFERIIAPAVGQVVELPQFIHYHLRDGKFVKVLCVIADP